jgi:hypothetical protein
MPLTGLDNFKLTESAFRRLGKARAKAYVNLRTYDLTQAVRRLPPVQRHDYLIERVRRWVSSLRCTFPELSFQTTLGKPLGEILQRSDMPSALMVSGSPRKIAAVARAAGVSTVHVVRVEGFRAPSRPTPKETWFCVRALVAICIEGQRAGMQSTEDRFLLVLARSFEDAKKRLSKSWPSYATPYMNSTGRLVSWRLDKIVDIYDVDETKIDPAGTEVYSRLGRRKMRPKFVWRPTLK